MKYPDAGINPAKSGLTARAGLYFNAGLHDKGDGFNLQDLDPYLLFDAETSMLGNLENPTLDLDPATPDTLDVITATRSGIATYTAADGQIVVADENTVRVDHVQGEELTPTKYQRVGYTDFDNSSQWYSYQVSIAAGQVSPIGDNSAFKITSTGTDPYVYSPIETSVGTNTFSFYCKGEGDSVGGTARVLFWHISGVSTATGTQESIDFTLTDEWQRFEFQHTLTGAGTLYYRIDVPANTSTAGHVAYLWGPQLEEGTTATDFVPNTTGSPKFIASATYGPRVPMVLIEPSATNLVPYSEDFEAGNWSLVALGTGSNPVITPDYAVSPDGTQNASRIQFDKGSGTASSDLSILRYNMAVTSGLLYSKSIYLKSNTSEAYDLILHESTDGSGTNVKKITVTPEWQRFDVYGAVPASDAGISFGLRNLNITGVSDTADVLAYGAQLEAGSVVTSYIPTDGGSVAERTRNGDQLSIIGSDFTNFFNGSEGTFFVTARIKDLQSSYAVLYSHGTARFLYSNNGHPYCYAYDGTNSVSFGSPNENADSNFALTYSSSNAEMESSRDGTYSATNAYNGNFSTATDLRIGWNNGTLNGHIRRILYWPTHSDSL